MCINEQHHFTIGRVESHNAFLSPNPPMDADGRREDSGRGVRELQAR